VAQGLEDAVAAGMTSSFTVVLGVVWGFYDCGSTPVRSDLRASHSRSWARVARGSGPGRVTGRGYRTKEGPAGWEEAGPSIIPLAHVQDVGEWRIVQTARGNRKGPEPPQKKRLRVVVARECT